MSDPCIHCHEEVAEPLRGIGGRPICGVCALQRIGLVLEVLSSVVPKPPKLVSPHRGRSSTLRRARVAMRRVQQAERG